MGLSSEEVLGAAKKYTGNIATEIGASKQQISTPVNFEVIDDHYVVVGTGAISEYNLFHMAEISVNAGEKYRVVGTHNAKCALYALYDANGNVISTYPTSSVSSNVTEGVEVTIPNNATTLKISALKTAGHLMLLYKITEGSGYTSFFNDVLYGKKWFACGDSFTAGTLQGYTDSEGHTGENSDAFDRELGVIKSFPYFIAKRTGINADWYTCALGGIGFTNISGAKSPFSVSTSAINYTKIPSDCDYITLQFGMNELNLTSEQIGTSEDATNETLWGAYNVVLTAILTANPTVKIGIIISDGAMCANTDYYEALIDIAKYWGIPYLDLSGGDDKVPMMNNMRGTHSSFAKTARGGAMALNYPSDYHPTPKGHEYRSTVIENFLRSL